MYLFWGKDMPVLPLEKKRYYILYFPDPRISEYLYDCCAGKRTAEPGMIQAVRIPLLNLEVRSVEQTEEFIRDVIGPILEKNKDILGEKVQLSV